MANPSPAAGLAALSICESLLLSLVDGGIIDAAEAKVILEDAATAHRNAIVLTTDGTAHAAAATLIDAILAGGNSVRRG
jgi:hypothetical protein